MTSSVSGSLGGSRRPAVGGGVCPVSWADDGPVVTAVVRCDPVIRGPDVAPMWPTLAQPSTVRVVDRRRGGDHTRLHDNARPEVPNLRQPSHQRQAFAPGAW